MWLYSSYCMKKKYFVAAITATTFAILFFAAPGVHAVLETNLQDITVPKGKVIEKMFWAYGKDVQLNGTFEDDVIVTAQKITVNGTIKGDLIAMSTADIIINGSVHGNVRGAVGGTILINNVVGKNITLIARHLILAQGGAVEGSMYYIGQNMELKGNIQGEIGGASDTAVIDGEIGGGVRLTTELLTLGKNAIIDGDLHYDAPQTVTIQDGAVVNGGVFYTFHEVQRHKGVFKSLLTFWKIVFFFGALAVGLVLIWLYGYVLHDVNEELIKNPYKCLLYGFLLCAALPVAAVVLVLSIIGVPLGILFMLMWGIGMYIAWIFSGIAVGEYLGRVVASRTQKDAKSSKKQSAIMSLVAGMALIHILSALPYVGLVVSFLAVIWGMGGLWIVKTRLLKNLRHP